MLPRPLRLLWDPSPPGGVVLSSFRSRDPEEGGGPSGRGAGEGQEDEEEEEDEVRCGRWEWGLPEAPPSSSRLCPEFPLPASVISAPPAACAEPGVWGSPWPDAGPPAGTGPGPAGSGWLSVPRARASASAGVSASPGAEFWSRAPSGCVWQGGVCFHGNRSWAPGLGREPFDVVTPPPLRLAPGGGGKPRFSDLGGTERGAACPPPGRRGAWERVGASRGARRWTRGPEALDSGSRAGPGQ